MTNRHYPTFPYNTPEQIAKFDSMALQRDKELEWSICLKPLEKSRSAAQNRLSHVIYAYIEKHSNDTLKHDIKSYCKYKFGLPIIIEEELELTEQFKTVLSKLTYEERITAMELIPLTSLLSVKQMAVYLTNVYTYFDSMGYQLPKPDDLYYSALGITKR